MEKNKTPKKQEIKTSRANTNPKIEEIVKDYPKSLEVSPRELFEDQLRKHLIKHKIK